MSQHAMTPDELLAEYRQEFKSRKFVAGVLLAFVRLFRDLGAVNAGYSSLDDLFRDFPQSHVAPGGRAANTLFVRTTDSSGKPKLVGLRPYYNEAERFFRSEQKRFDYPNCAPHATQSWQDYRRWADALLVFTDAEIARIEEAVKDYVLAELPSHDINPASITPLERHFTTLIREFPLTAQKGEPRGAAFQGLVYAYIRADAPHLHLDISKVGAGSKRLQRVGDIDGWEGERLVLSVEVKHFTLRPQDVPDLAAFANAVARHQAMGIVAATAFASDARAELEAAGLRTVDTGDLARLVDLWDPLKQRAATAAFAYYVHHIEKNSALISRLTTFLTEVASVEQPEP